MRVSSKTYYGYSGRLKDNRGVKKTTVLLPEPVVKKKFAECSCTKMIVLVEKVFVDHHDNFGLPCDGSGQPKDFWRY